LDSACILYFVNLPFNKYNKVQAECVIAHWCTVTRSVFMLTNVDRTEGAGQNISSGPHRHVLMVHESDQFVMNFQVLAHNLYCLWGSGRTNIDIFQCHRVDPGGDHKIPSKLIVCSGGFLHQKVWVDSCIIGHRLSLKHINFELRNKGLHGASAFRSMGAWSGRITKQTWSFACLCVCCCSWAMLTRLWLLWSVKNCQESSLMGHDVVNGSSRAAKCQFSRPATQGAAWS
jgi:hypothetical protein